VKGSELDTHQIIFNKYIREIPTNASIVVEMEEGKFLLYDYRDDTFVLMDALKD
jgi:hypothetical protein